MKNKLLFLTIINTFLFSLDLIAQDQAFLTEIPVLTGSEIEAIEHNLPIRLLHEGETRTPDQFSAIVLVGDNANEKRNTGRYLAQLVNVPIYRIDLSMLDQEDSRERGNILRVIFELTAETNCVLYFDEAEALFGNRNPVQDSHDKYDDEETNYFLDLVNTYRTPVIISATVHNDINPLIFEKYVRFQIP